MIKDAYACAAIMLLRPYIRRELPGWGAIYNWLIGASERDTWWEKQPHRHIVGKLHGYQMSLRISGWSNRATYFLGRFYDLPTQLLLQEVLEPGDTMLDIGANEGMITLLAAKLVGGTGKVIAFEPNPVPLEILRDNISINKIKHVEIHGVGLSDAPGTLSLFVPEVNSGQGTFTDLHGLDGHTVDCEVVVADEIVGGIPVTVVKIDVEGFEMRVLYGLMRMIHISRPVIVIEMVADHLMRDNVSPSDIVEFLTKQGYVGKRLGIARKGRGHVLTQSSIPVPWQDGDYVWTPD
jgi:FkbM family methyltransferase